MVRGLKKIFIFGIFCLLSANICFADNMSDIVSGIEDYKAGNYQSCITKMQSVVNNDPTTVIGYYYLGLAYTKTNKKEQAIKNYTKVINLGSDNTLVALAKKGKANLRAEQVQKEVKEIVNQKENETAVIQEEYNPIFQDAYIQKEKTFKQEKQSAVTEKPEPKQTKVVQKEFVFDPNREPTNDEIVTAIKILQKAGLLQNGASAITGGAQTQQQNPYQNQIPQIDSRAQQMYSMMQMMNNGNNNNGMMNMIPYMQSGGKMDPQMIKMMMMQQMMPNFSSGNNNGGY